jgi:hypothetical protein
MIKISRSFWKKYSWSWKRYSTKRKKNIVNKLGKLVVEYNNNLLNNHEVLISDNYKIEKNDWLQVNLIQLLAYNYEQIIIAINYTSPLIQIIVPRFVCSIISDQDQLVSLTYQEIIERRGYIFEDFQE